MQGNRIDSRARGNAPQLLDKYKKLAHEAAMNDDRVQTEYYLQFADHYFRVIADNKAQKDEAQAKRNAERGNNSSDDDEDDDGQEERQNDRQNDRKPRRKNGRPRKGDDDQNSGSEGETGDQSDGDNPFVRDAAKPKAARKPRKKKEEASDVGDSLDIGVLPPAISRADDSDGGEEKPRRKLGTRRKVKDDAPKDDGGDALEAVG